MDSLIPIQRLSLLYDPLQYVISRMEFIPPKNWGAGNLSGMKPLRHVAWKPPAEAKSLQGHKLYFLRSLFTKLSRTTEDIGDLRYSFSMTTRAAGLRQS